MKIHSESRISHPRPLVYATYRDRLPEVAPFMNDINPITVVSREQTSGGARLLNRWQASTEIPKIVQRFVTPDMLCWDDHAEWHDDAFACDWTLTIPAFPEQVRCSGRNRFIDEGGHTRVILSGELHVDAARIPGVPRMLARTVAPQVEKFIVRLITPNLEKVNHSLGAFLDAQ